MFLKNIMNKGYAIRASIFPIHQADMIATNKWKSEQAAIGLNGGLIRHLRTKLRTQIGVGCLTGAKRLLRPLRNLA